MKTKFVTNILIFIIISISHLAFCDEFALLHDIENLFEEYSNKEILRICDDALKANPDNPQALAVRCRVFRLTGNLDEAEINCQKALNIDSENKLAWHEMGTINFEKKNFEKAIDYLTNAINTDPEWSWPYNNLGVVYTAIHDYEKGLLHINRAIELQPDYWRYHSGKGITLLSQSMYHEDLPPYIMQMYISKENALENKDLVTEALSAFDTAFELAPNEPEVVYYRSLCYHLLDKPEKALEDLKSLVESNDNCSKAHLLLGIIYMDYEEYDKSIAEFNSVIDIYPENALAYATRGNAHYLTGKFTDAARDYEKALSFDRDNHYLYYLLGTVYSHLERAKDAIACLDRAIELGFETPRIFHDRGRMYYHYRKDYSNALKDYRKALELDNEYAEVYFYRGKLYYEVGEYGLALEDFRNAKKYGHPESVNGYITAIYLRKYWYVLVIAAAAIFIKTRRMMANSST